MQMGITCLLLASVLGIVNCAGPEANDDRAALQERIRELEARNRELEVEKQQGTDVTSKTNRKKKKKSKAPPTPEEKAYWAEVNDRAEVAADNTCPRSLTAACNDLYDSRCPPCACCQTCSRCSTGKYFKDLVCDDHTGFRCGADESAHGAFRILLALALLASFFGLVAIMFMKRRDFDKRSKFEWHRQ
eukprot:gnl/TRDRNA2_/TRDRNA2_170569_c0_seq1.p1 gnl/TRDRNA2_/TRDRNA2_170569_c0~~gnl/TRDRNA2_/TRDRNA2_170569_c0_seq1.p1  ORF type:complete len:189 (-),score=25.61 gnl/TRDRNA2_/TRDRNA2_170569_c0_seq1:160-726(-)